jgi:hypothetical protein
MLIRSATPDLAKAKFEFQRKYTVRTRHALSTDAVHGWEQVSIYPSKLRAPRELVQQPVSRGQRTGNERQYPIAEMRTSCRASMPRRRTRIRADGVAWLLRMCRVRMPAAVTQGPATMGMNQLSQAPGLTGTVLRWRMGRQHMAIQSTTTAWAGRQRTSRRLRTRWGLWRCSTWTRGHQWH